MFNRKKRIAICAAQIPFNYGGAEILVEELNNQLNMRGYQSEIINVPFKWYPKEQLIDNALQWKMVDLTESNGEKIDQVICTKYPTYVINHPNKVVWLFHQHRPVYDLLDTPYTEFSKTGNDLKIINHIRQIDNRTLAEAKKIYCISENVRNRLKEYNGIESEVLYPPTKLDGSYKEGNFEKYIFSAGRLDPLKRVELLIQALKFINKEYKLVIAGKGKHEEKLRDLVVKEGVEDRVKFSGFVNDETLINYYSNASMIFFAPKDEDYGFITIEAFKSGKPVITTNDSGGVLEFVRHNGNGLVCNPNSREIADNINNLIENQEKLFQLGKKGIETVKYINWDHTIKSLVIE
ncbi:glycosyltransferase family 4 protein [Paenibacillus filicis]|uniref:Glycosyltransferase family 4 protein n=1 Tax=Paenibacillus gyeongsangnamensis TaxID=3388067 RepID=A0ABT4Q6Q3_9BACL|nr:glycosyltransferase family 4 protein [Paenibacillus filicis]MCZ8512555.1 glycosyltransferase family 4 protein [Paenibacillus filicis]